MTGRRTPPSTPLPCPPMDQVHIRDLEIEGIIGINPDERVNPQPVRVNATLYTDTRRAGESDDIADAVNYRTVTKRMIGHIQDGQPMLVERLVAELVRICFESDERIQEVELSVEKPGAVTHSRSVGVTIRRSREEVMET